MKELLNKCTPDQLTRFTRDCAEHANVYDELADMYAARYAAWCAAEYAARCAENAEYAAKWGRWAAKGAAKHAQNAAKYAGIGREVERQRQIEFLTSMLEQNK